MTAAVDLAGLGKRYTAIFAPALPGANLGILLSLLLFKAANGGTVWGRSWLWR